MNRYEFPPEDHKYCDYCDAKGSFLIFISEKHRIDPYYIKEKRVCPFCRGFKFVHWVDTITRNFIEIDINEIICRRNNIYGAIDLEFEISLTKDHHCIIVDGKRLDGTEF